MSQVTRNYTCFAGAAIKAVLHGKVVGTLIGISYTITREVTPLYSKKGGDPIGFFKGKRDIAGTLIFQEIDADAIGDVVDECETPGPHEIPFDIQIVYGEQHAPSLESLLGVQLVDGGEDCRIDKMKPGLSYSFVCRHVTAMIPAPNGRAKISQMRE